MTVLTKSRLRSSIAASALILSIVVSPSIAMVADLGTQGIQSLGQVAPLAERIC